MGWYVQIVQEFVVFLQKDMPLVKTYFVILLKG